LLLQENPYTQVKAALQSIKQSAPMQWRILKKVRLTSLFPTELWCLITAGLYDCLSCSGSCRLKLSMRCCECGGWARMR
jgi:hypothetical protein